MSNPCTISYLPPPSFPGATSYLLNLRQWKTRYPLILFSDHDYGEGVIKLRGTPESIRGAQYADGRPNKWALNNYVWLTALRILREKDFTHMLWMESDSRVLGHYWDEIVFEEALAGPKTPLMAGSVVCYSICNAGHEIARAWQQFLADNASNPHVIPAYGGNGAAEAHPPVAFPNGSLSVYDIAWVSSHFDLSEPPPPPLPSKRTPMAYNLAGGPAPQPPTELAGTKKIAAETTAFDYHLGRKLMQEFGPEAFGKLRHLRSTFSSFGDVMTSVMERRQMLLNGEIVAFHQEKTDWRPDVTVAPQRIVIGSVKQRIDLEEQRISPAASATLDAFAQIAEAIGTTQMPKEFTLPDLRRYKPRVDILIVSHAPDFHWLSFCLRSIAKYATGFGETVVVIPEKDQTQFKMMAAGVGKNDRITLPYTLHTYQEPPPPLGHLGHLIIKCHADIYSQADFICHVDSDCVFTEPVTPDDYFVDGKPVLLIEEFEHVKDKNALWWQTQTERALGMGCAYLGMCRHPSVHHRFIYKALRDRIEHVHRIPFEEYVLKQKPTRLPGFSEFCALSAFALSEQYDQYHWIDITNAPEKRPKDKLKQHWSFEKWTPELVATLEEICR